MLVNVRNLALRGFHGAVETLAFDVPAGGWHIVVAPSGSGKSAACAKIVGLDFNAPLSQTLVSGRDVHLLSIAERAQTMALLPPQATWAFSLIGDTAEDEIDLGAGFMGREIPSSKKDWIIGSLNLGRLLDRSTGSLSGGESARIALATVLARDPQVLVLDQALDSCDPSNRRLVQRILAEWLRRSGGAVIEFATSWKDRDLLDVPLCLSTLTATGWVQGSPDKVWLQLGSAASDYFEGVDGLAARAFCDPSHAVTRSSAIHALVDRHAATSSRAVDSSTLKCSFPNNGLDVKGLNFSYGDGCFHLDNVSFIAPKGTITALLGPNGSGKTTLLRCLGNLAGPWTGSRTWCNESLPNDLRPHQIASKLIYAFQNPDDQIYRATVEEELLECRNNLRGRGHCLSKWEQDLLSDLNFGGTHSGSPFSLPLSRRRLLMIASSLIAKTPVVLLDEPTAWLDPVQKRALACALRRFIENDGTVLMISHDMDFVGRYADRFLRLENGKIVASIETMWASRCQLPDTTPSADISERAGLTERVWKETPFLSMLKTGA
jgi:energy-coupling factor transport system ATP-binding protein